MGESVGLLLVTDEEGALGAAVLGERVGVGDAGSTGEEKG